MHAGGPRQRNVAHRVAAVPRRHPASAAALVTVLIVCCGALPGGRARAATTGTGLTISPPVIGAAQLPATFTTSHFRDTGEGVSDVVLVDGQKAQDGTDNNGDVTFFASPSCGQHQVDVQYFIGGGGPDQEFFGTFFVSCITATPGSITAAQQPTAITVAGSAFIPLTPLQIQIDGAQVAQVTLARGVDALNTTATARGLTCGTHTVTATQTYIPFVEAPPATITATAPLTVTQCARLAVNPPVMPDGTLTHVTGTGFNPGEQVTITWQGPGGAVLDACSPNAIGAPAVIADAAGNIDVFCLALAHESLGAEQISADQAATAQLSGEQATAPVVVEGGSMQPSTGDELIFRR